MSLVVLDNVSLAYGKKVLLQGLDLRVDAHDRIGLVGSNGSGKSSLLRMLAGEASPDSGTLRPRRDLHVGHLPQDIESARGCTVLASVLESVPGRPALEQELARAEAELERANAAGDEDGMVAVAEQLGELHARLAGFDRDWSEHEARRILAGLGFRPGDADRDLGELSGGWRMRARLAALLFQRPDLLLLDEPTNHLDMPTVAWFGAFLRGYPGAFVLVCHDRDFLNEQIERVVALEPEGVRQFRGDWEQYSRARADEEVVLENQARNVQRERDKAQQFIDRFRAQANKAKAVQSRIKAIERMDEVRLLSRREVMRFRFPPCERTGDEVIRLERVRKQYGDNVVLGGVDLRVMRGERIGIIGVNGAGKTTLLRLVAGELRPDGGRIVLGHKVKLGYYAQHHADALDPGRTVLEEVAARNSSLGTTAVRTLLGAFLFHDEDVDKPIAVLSGGERSRVALAHLLVQPGNVLLMDEPTNHLDLESSEALVAALATFDGTLVFVSHNRSFVRRLATKIWNIEDARVDEYPGTLDEYLDRHRGDADGPDAPAPSKPARPTVASAPARPSVPASTPARPSAPDDRRARRRADAERRAERGRTIAPLERRVAEMEARIEQLEAEQKQRNLELARPELYDDPPRRQAVLGDYQRAAAELAALGEAWELAQAELERAKSDVD